MAVFLFKQSDWLIASKTLRPPLHLVSWPRCWPQCWSALGDSLMHWQPIVQSLSSDWFSELLRERLAEVYARPEECRPARPLPQKARNYPNLCLLSSPQEYPCGIRTRVTKRLSLSFCSEALAPASAFSLAALDRPQLFLCRLWHQPQLFLWRLWHIGLSFFLAGCTFCDKESRFVSNLSPVARVSSNLCCFSPFRTSFCI